MKRSSAAIIVVIVITFWLLLIPHVRAQSWCFVTQSNSTAVCVSNQNAANASQSSTLVSNQDNDYTVYTNTLAQDLNEYNTTFSNWTALLFLTNLPACTNAYNSSVLAASNSYVSTTNLCATNDDPVMCLCQYAGAYLATIGGYLVDFVLCYNNDVADYNYAIALAAANQVSEDNTAEGVYTRDYNYHQGTYDEAQVLSDNAFSICNSTASTIADNCVIAYDCSIHYVDCCYDDLQIWLNNANLAADIAYDNTAAPAQGTMLKSQRHCFADEAYSSHAADGTFGSQQSAATALYNYIVAQTNAAATFTYGTYLYEGNEAIDECICTNTAGIDCSAGPSAIYTAQVNALNAATAIGLSNQYVIYTNIMAGIQSNYNATISNYQFSYTICMSNANYTYTNILAGATDVYNDTMLDNEEFYEYELNFCTPG